MLISVVIPCYRSELTIEGVVDELIEVIGIREEYQYEIILVNDGSPDNLDYKIREISGKYSEVKYIQFAKNFGQASAKMAGFKYAQGEYIVCVDDDGQIAIDELYKLIDKLEEGYDVVYAKYKTKQHSKVRNIGSKINNYMGSLLMNKPSDLTITSFMVMRKFVAKQIIKYDNPYPYPFGLIVAATSKITNVETNHRTRVAGKSNYNLKRLVRLWLNGATNFSIKPLRVSILLGGMSALVGFCYGIFVVINKFYDPTIQAGWSSIISIILFMSGIILCMLGIIGEYVGRIYMSLNNIPQYTIKNEMNFRNSSNKLVRDNEKEEVRYNE